MVTSANSRHSHVKVIFYLEEGYGVESEGMWCWPEGEAAVRVDQIPLFTPGVSCEDIVRIVRQEGVAMAVEVIADGGFSTLWVDCSLSEQEGRLRVLGEFQQNLISRGVDTELERQTPRLAACFTDGQFMEVQEAFNQFPFIDVLESTVSKCTPAVDRMLTERAEEA